MKTKALIPALLVLLIVAAVLAAPDGTKEDRAREAFADRDFKSGVTLLTELIAEEPDSPRNDERRMMVVRGLSLTSDHEAAAEAGLAFLEKHPTSIYREKVAFLAAESLLEVGRGETASELMAASFDRMTGPEMRTFIAEVYRKAADRAFAGKKPTGPFDPGVEPDYPKALRLYGRAKAAGIPAAERYEALLRYAAAAFETKGYDVAIAVLAEAAKAGDADDPRLLLLRGRSLLAAKRRPAAREALERIFAVARGSKEAPEALLLLGQPDDLERLLREYPAHERAPEAAYRRGVALARSARLDEAVPALLDAARTYPSSPYAPKSVLAAADSLFRAKDFDDAQVRYDEYLRRYPESAEWAKVREKLTEAWFWRGKQRLDLGARDDAVTIWRALRNTYPLSRLAPVTLSETAKGVEGEKALAPLRELLTRYPGSKPAPDAALRVGLLLAAMPGHMADAAEALRLAAHRYGGTKAGNEARRRLTEMQAESILVELPAPVRPGERPELVLRTRNLKNVSGRVYRIDPEVYFLKHGGFGGIERVMVDVIAPDGKFAHAVGDYEDFREIEGRLSIPVEGEGAWIVTVEGGTLRATGLLLVSGIDLVTKESARGALAFVTDAATGKPVGGAKILSSRTRNHKSHPLTDADGTARVGSGHGSGACAFLAIRGKSVALKGYGGLARKMRGFKTTVHISTDRPVYRPGHEVTFRAVVRERSGSYFRTPAGHEVLITVTDGVGNDLYRQKTRLGDFGTAAGSFTLPEDLPPRQYQVRLRHKKTDYTGDFLVKAYRKPGVFLEVEPDRPVFVRGETVAFAVRARYSFGRPMPRQPVTVSTWTRIVGGSTQAGPVRELVTGEDGTVRVEIPTVAGPDMEVAVRVETTDATRRRYAGDAVIPVASTGYQAVLTADRERVFVGEAVNLTLLTSDFLGEPVAASGKIRVAQSAKTIGEPIEAVTKDEGRVVIRWEPPADGAYRFIYEGKDRAGREVRASADVTVFRTASGVTVRADRPDHRVGDTALVTVTAPATGGHALITWEGEEVIGHRVVKLTSGRNEIEVPVLASFVPNLWVSATMISERRLFTGKDHLSVSEVLNVEVRSAKEEYGPGDTCRLTVTTKDGRGKPLAAEVALGVVDEALYRLFPDLTPALAKAFTPPLRKHFVRTGASTEFTWRGTTTTLSPDLLAERDRRLKATKPRKGVLLEDAAMEDEIAPQEHLFLSQAAERAGYQSVVIDLGRPASLERNGIGVRLANGVWGAAVSLSC
jgi:TolA-binding protein